MNYQEFRATARSGDVVMVEGRTAISHMIRMATGQNISHVAMCVRMGDNLMLAEMREFKAFRIGRASDRLQNDMGGARLYHGECPDAVRVWIDSEPTEFLDGVFSARNSKYGYMQLLPILWAQFKNRKRREKANLVCSTYVQKVWELSGWAGDTMADPGDYMYLSKSTTPLKLEEYYT